MKNIFIFINKHRFIGPSLYIMLQAGVHFWIFDTIMANYWIWAITAITILAYMLVRIKDPGQIPVVHVQLQSNNQRDQIYMIEDDNERQRAQQREVLEAQQDDESKLRISLDQIKDQNEIDNQVQKSHTEMNQKVENEQHDNPQQDTRLVMSGRDAQIEILSSPSEQIQIAKQAPQTIINQSFDKRYCMKCLNDQPVRAKHCQYCNKCIPLFDHHCPWIGTCIGEKNKLLFICYLFIQQAQIICTICIQQSNIYVLVITSIFEFLVLLLTAYQIFYISKNVTTSNQGEYLSKTKITYMKSQYPFDHGLVRNIQEFLSYSFKSEIIDWQLN
ncbi:Pfam:zf-DHHC [Paramecium bursaria]